MPRTRQRTPELRDRLLAAALDLLAESGAAGLTARSLAKRVRACGPPALGPVPDRPSPPNGCTPTTAPMIERFT